MRGRCARRRQFSGRDHNGQFTEQLVTDAWQPRVAVIIIRGERISIPYVKPCQEDHEQIRDRQ